MTTGQPIKFHSDINKYNNEYAEALQLQININQTNLEANRLYKQTGQLPASTQMMDTRSNEEKLMDVFYLRQQIVSDLSPIAEPAFANAVVTGVSNSPLNVDNSLFRYLAQNAQTFALTLSKKYKFGIAGDANDVAIMVQFLEDAYVKTKNSFQSIKGYINSNTNEGNKSRSSLLSANDTDNIISELTDIQKRCDIYIRQLVADQQGVLTPILRGIFNKVNNILKFLPNSAQMENILNNMKMQGAVGGMPNIIYNAFDILKQLPKLSSVQTLLDNIDRGVKTRTISLVQGASNGLDMLFEAFDPAGPNGQILAQFRYVYLNMEHNQQRLNVIKSTEDINAENAQRRNESNAQRVYIVNPANDPVNVIGNMNLGNGGGGGGGDGDSDGGSSYNLPFGNSIQGDPMQQRQDDYENSADIIDNANRNNPAGYARDMRQLNAQYQDLVGYGVLRDPDDHPVFGKAPMPIPPPPSKKAPLAPSKKASSSSSSVSNSPGGSSSKVAPVARDYSIESKVSSLTDNQVNDMFTKIFKTPPYGSISSRKKAIREYLIALHNYDPQDPNQQKYNISGLGLKPVKKGRGLYSPFGDNEINHKNLEKNILTIRRKSKTNYMDLPSKHISKNMKNIIHNIVGGKIANFEDMHNLTDEERDYLSKVISKSNLQDRLSVPAPSKDQADKDNHQWEVMRGEIMAGNDSHELVKKFKILTLKLTRQGLLPKNEVMDLFEDLIALGY
jgi:hypothetical protein